MNKSTQHKLEKYFGKVQTYKELADEHIKVADNAPLRSFLREWATRQAMFYLLMHEAENETS